MTGSDTFLYFWNEQQKDGEGCYGYLQFEQRLFCGGTEKKRMKRSAGIQELQETLLADFDQLDIR